MTTDTIDTIDVGADFSIAPYGGRRQDSDYSGERFREEFLKPIFTEPGKYSRPVTIILDTAEAYSAAFLQEAFGGLVREGYATPDEFNADVKLVIKERQGFGVYVRVIDRFLAEAAEERSKKKQQAGGG